MLDISATPYNATREGDPTDNRVAIQSAIDDAAGSVVNDAVVYFPTGVWPINLSSNVGLKVPSNVTLLGDGAGLSILKLESSSVSTNSALVSLEAYDDMADEYIPVENISIREMTLTLEDVAATSGADLRAIAITRARGRRITMESLAFARDAGSTTGTGIYAGGGTSSTALDEHIRIHRCRFEHMGRRGVAVEKWAAHIQISGCTFERATGSSAWKAVEITDTVTSTTSDSIIIQDLKLLGNTFGSALTVEISGKLNSAGTAATVRDVSFGLNQTEGLVSCMQVDHIVVLGNHMHPSTNRGLLLTRCFRAPVVGNTVEANTNIAIDLDGRADNEAAVASSQIILAANALSMLNTTSRAIFAQAIHQLIIAANTLKAPASSNQIGLSLSGGNGISGNRTHQAILLANAFDQFLYAVTFACQNDGYEQVIAALNLIAAHTGSGTKGFHAYSSANPDTLKRVALTCNGVNNDTDASLGGIGNYLIAGMLGKDSEAAAPGQYIINNTMENLEMGEDYPYIVNAAAGSLATRSNGVSDETLYVKEGSTWDPK